MPQITDSYRSPQSFAERLRQAEMVALDLYVMYLGERLGLFRCGTGWSSIAMAGTYPRITVDG